MAQELLQRNLLLTFTVGCSIRQSEVQLQTLGRILLRQAFQHFGTRFPRASF